MPTMLKNQDSGLIDTFYINNKIKRLYFEKTYFTIKDAYQYFLKLYSIDPNGTYICEGYIYFYLDELKKESNFIGLYVKPEYRNTGIASLLISNWLKICIDNGYYHFTTSKKQRKPFLLYLLKKVGFEIIEPSKYEQSNFTITLYKNIFDSYKYLSFKSQNYAANFMQSSIAKEDNYALLPDLKKDNFIYLDQVLLSHIYVLQDENTAYTRSRRKIESYK